LGVVWKSAFVGSFLVILLTGASGRIGKVVIDDLLNRGYAVRATTRKSSGGLTGEHPNLEWFPFDFETDRDYDSLLSRCTGVVHLAAELGDMSKMERVNAEATAELARASERNLVKSFCYVSSVSVYGSGSSVDITEDSPVLTHERDIKSEYWALDYVRMYGRTKLKGELAIRDVARNAYYTILRPTVVVSVDNIIGIREWSLVKRALAGHRHAHHLYVDDLSDVILWSLQRGLDEPSRRGDVDTFIVAEDDYSGPRHKDFMRKAAAVSRDPRFRVPTIPGFADWLHDFLRFHSLPPRNPLWKMRFSSERLAKAGYRRRFGLAHAERMALEQLAHEASPDS
jgi:nucleoside-diphosphate-sugar epimerase